MSHDWCPSKRGVSKAGFPRDRPERTTTNLSESFEVKINPDIWAYEHGYGCKAAFPGAGAPAARCRRRSLLLSCRERHPGAACLPIQAPPPQGAFLQYGMFGTAINYCSESNCLLGAEGTTYPQVTEHWPVLPLPAILNRSPHKVLGGGKLTLSIQQQYVNYSI